MKKLLSAGLLMATALTAMGATAAPKIGLSIDDLRVERWTRDRDYFVAKAKELGAEVVVQSANASEATQIQQIENMITQGVDVIVIVPFNSKALSNVIEEAQSEGIKVVSYDRLILDSDIDLYISFDNVRVGEMQAQGLVDVKPTGNYYLIGGSQLDNNAFMFREGQMNVLKPLADKGDITILGDQWAKDWLPEEAVKITENALSANDNKIDAIVASNDGLAGGAIQALSAQGLAGKVAVSGQDADLEGIKRIVAGTQTVTVYKPLKLIAETAAQIAYDFAEGKEVETTSKLDNGKKEVPSVLLAPTAVTKDNVDEAVIADGFYTKEQVYGK
ncbi:MAG: D-xylose ABC transporter substrate-binding protein [Alphaproteobacteria bacterium]